eukprot:4509859-Pleurochrysis_carterae.AAC.1
MPVRAAPTHRSAAGAEARAPSVPGRWPRVAARRAGARASPARPPPAGCAPPSLCDDLRTTAPR